MKTVSYSDLENSFSERCFPEQSGLDSSQKAFFFSYLKESISELWEKFDWDFAIDIEEFTPTSSNIIDTGDLGEAGDSRILQVWSGHPVTDRKAKNLAFRNFSGKLFFSKTILNKNLFIKYKRSTPLVTKDLIIPLFLAQMLLALCVYHWESGQQRYEQAQVALANYERLAQVEIQKQSLASVRSNSINARGVPQ